MCRLAINHEDVRVLETKSRGSGVDELGGVNLRRTRIDWAGGRAEGEEDGGKGQGLRSYWLGTLSASPTCGQKQDQLFVSSRGD